MQGCSGGMFPVMQRGNKQDPLIIISHEEIRDNVYKARWPHKNPASFPLEVCMSEHTSVLVLVSEY